MTKEEKKEYDRVRYLKKKSEDGWIKRKLEMEKKTRDIRNSDPIYLTKKRQERKDRLKNINTNKYKEREYKKSNPCKIKCKAKNKVRRYLGRAKDGFHFHHWSYNEEDHLSVFELSIKDHNRIHSYMRYNKEKLKYETLCGILIDTKEFAEKLINLIKKTKPGYYPGEQIKQIESECVSLTN